MLTTTTSNEKADSIPVDGKTYGNAITDLISFYGVAPVAQPAAAAQAAVTDASGGTASATAGIALLPPTYNSAILNNAIATLAAQGNALRAALVSVGIIKGSS